MRKAGMRPAESLQKVSILAQMFLPDVFYEPKIRPKCVSVRGSAPNPAGGAHDDPPDPLVG